MTSAQLWSLLEYALAKQGPDLFVEYLQYWAYLDPPNNDFATFLQNAVNSNIWP